MCTLDTLGASTFFIAHNKTVKEKILKQACCAGSMEATQPIGNVQTLRKVAKTFEKS